MIKIISIIISFTTILFGYKLNKFLIAILGFIIGFNIINDIIAPMALNETLTLIIPILGALSIALISFKLYLAGVFILCFLATYYLCNIYLPLENLKIISVILGIILGIIGIKFTRPMIIIFTSISGSSLLVDALNIDSYISILIIIILSVFGIYFQFKNTKE